MKYFTKILLISFISICCYWNTLNGSFVFDDTEAVIKNNDVYNNNPLKDLFQHDFWGTPLKHKNSHKSYRPITILSFRLNNYLDSQFQPNAYAYHSVNIALYTIICVLTFVIFQKFFQLSELPNVTKEELSFVSALLYTVHPIHVESVAAIVGRADLLCTLFYWLAILLYHEVLRQNRNMLKYLYYLMASFMVIISMFSKETGITVLGIVSIYDFLVSDIVFMDVFKYIISTFANTPTNSSKAFNKRIKVRNLIVRQVLNTLLGIFLMLLRLNVMGFESPKFQLMDNPASFNDNILTRILTYNYIYSLNSLLLIWPQWLCFDWSMGCIPLVKICDYRVIGIIFFWVSILLTLRSIQYSKNMKRTYTIIFCLTVVPFLPASNIFFRVGFVLAERTLFLPSAGFCMLIVLGMYKLETEFHIKKKLISSCYILLISVFILKTINRNIDWLTEKTLYHSALSVCPNNAKVHYNVAKVAADNGDLYLAENEYNIAISLYPEYDQAMNNLANLLRDQRRLDEAEKLLRSAIHIRPDFAAAWMNLGIVLSSKKQVFEAEECYRNALKYRPKYADCYYNLGNLFLDEKKYQNAISSWRTAINLKPTHTSAWSNLLVLLDSEGNIDEAVSMGIQAITLQPNEHVLHFSLANSLGKLKRWNDAENHFLKAIKLNPTNALYHSNLGVLYHRWNDIVKARKYYEKALHLNPNLRSAQDNLQKLKKYI